MRAIKLMQKARGIYSFVVKNDFVRHVCVLSGASVLAQMINVLSIPLLSRLYSPQDFGVLSLFTSVVNLLATASGFRYYLVLPLARRERYVHAIVWLSVILQLSFVSFIAILLALFGHCAEGTPYNVLMPYRYLIPVGVLCIGMYSLAVQWGIREKSFTLIAKTKLSQVLAALAINILSAVVSLRPLGLLLGSIAGQSCGISVLFRTLLKRAGKIRCDFTRIKRAAVCYRRMCFFDTPAALLNMAGAYFLPLLIAFYFSPVVVGSFSMAQNALVLPSAVVGNAIGQVFTQKAAEARNNGTLSLLTARMFELLARIGLFPVLLCSTVAPWLFPWLLGESWRQSGELAVLLGPWIALNFVYTPMSTLYTTLMLQRMGLMFVSVYTIVRLGSVVLGAASPSAAILGLSVSGTFMLVIGLCLLLFKAGVSGIIRRWARIIFEVLLALSPIYFVKVCSDITPLKTVLAVLTGFAIYAYFTLRYIKKDY